jgi:hypothetical protein
MKLAFLTDTIRTSPAKGKAADYNKSCLSFCSDTLGTLPAGPQQELAVEDFYRTWQTGYIALSAGAESGRGAGHTGG